MAMTIPIRVVLIDGATAAAMSVAGSEFPEYAPSQPGRTMESLDMIIVGAGAAAAPAPRNCGFKCGPLAHRTYPFYFSMQSGGGPYPFSAINGTDDHRDAFLHE
jgi:hypothetical protein